MQKAPQRILSAGCVLLLAFLARAPLSGRTVQDDVQVVTVTAERFTFTPSEIRVARGRTLRVDLRSEDTAHGFRITGTDVNVEIPKRSRGTISVTFTPTEGRYTFECSKLCGAGHSFMRGIIVVVEAQ
jgi:cytochrome c oxidase subunit 2